MDLKYAVKEAIEAHNCFDAERIEQAVADNIHRVLWTYKRTARHPILVGPIYKTAICTKERLSVCQETAKRLMEAGLNVKFLEDHTHVFDFGWCPPEVFIVSQEPILVAVGVKLPLRLRLRYFFWGY